MKLSARNQLKGVITALKEGMIHTEVEIQLPCGQKIVSVVTCSTVPAMGLAVGKEAIAVVKASSVLIAVEG